TVLVNNQTIDEEALDFVHGKAGLIPVLTPALLESYGVKVAAVPALAKLPRDGKLKGELADYIPLATTTFDFGRQQLNISIPQAYVSNLARGEVSPAYWDEGVPALIAGYNFSGSNTWQDDGGDARDDSYFLNLRSGLNVGAWRLRNYSTWSYTRASARDADDLTDDGNARVSSTDNSQDGSHWDSVNTFLQRDIPALKAQMDLGDTTTPSDVFDGFQFRGVQLATDDTMLPDSLRNFAPTVRGIANSNAKVTIRQNNTVIYESYVPPGAFVINDLYPNSTNGDLNVTVTEADGSTHSFVQAFSSVAIMQREGQIKYAVTGGQYRSGSGGNEPDFAQLSAVYGLSHSLTLYGGVQGSDDYKAALAGAGFGLWDLGAVSVDLTQSQAQLSDETQKNGQSVRIQYSKSLVQTGSTLTLAAYRYSTKGFYTFQEANDLRSDYDNSGSESSEELDDQYNLQHNKRSRMQADISQTLDDGRWGSLYLSGYQQDYWGGDGYERSLNVGYNDSVQGISYGVTYSYTTTPGAEANQMVAFNISVPLSRWLPQAWAGYNVNSSKNGPVTQQATLYGTALADNNLSYNLSEGYGSQGIGNSGNVSLDYKGAYGEVNGGYNYTPDNKRINYGLQGGIVAHPHGVTFSQPISGDVQSIAVVRAPGLAGATVQNSVGVKTDSRGYAVVPYLSAYRRTTVSLDTQSLGDGADVENSTSQVVPTAGAVVMAEFKTHIGARVLMTLHHGGSAVPFGATATLAGDDGNAGIVSDGGQVYLSGVPASGTVLAKWG
ncbi:fimbria/pilus outer membrane usher protein, partial [Rahnella contaminans]|uniref:fimbria/pilus outer membrane usher protein n=1 Tax=Rahnella contaminans TaxID=2703882 RepID=UPI003C2D0FE7